MLLQFSEVVRVFPHHTSNIIRYAHAGTLGTESQVFDESGFGFCTSVSLISHKSAARRCKRYAARPEHLSPKKRKKIASRKNNERNKREREMNYVRIAGRCVARCERDMHAQSPAHKVVEEGMDATFCCSGCEDIESEHLFTFSPARRKK